MDIGSFELIPKESRRKIKKWSNYTNYWGADWDFQNDTFTLGWVAFRTRKERRLTMTSEVDKCDKPGKYRIRVKVIDILGSDNSQAFGVEVR